MKRRAALATFLAGAALLLPACVRRAEAPRRTNLKTILLTGFEPFGEGRTNSSWEAVKVLDGKVVAGHRIVARRIPVVWDAPMQRLQPLLEKHQPVAVFAFGQEFDGVFRFEKIGRNKRDASLQDNRGKFPAREEIIEGGREKYVASSGSGRSSRGF